MNALFANPVALTVVPPLAAGLVLGLVAWATSGNRVTMAIGWSLGVLFVYWLLEGVPPLPPIAAKQKLGYLIALGALAGAAYEAAPFGKILPQDPAKAMVSPPAFATVASAILAAVAAVWLGWTKMSDPANSNIVMLTAGVMVIFAAGMIGCFLAASTEQSTRQVEEHFLAPAAFLTSAIAGSVVAASGLFLGMGQMLGALAAMLGGALAVGYLALLTGGRRLTILPPGAILAVGNAVLGCVLLTALLAPSASNVALGILAFGPILAARFEALFRPLLPGSTFLRPILAGAIIAIPAIAASLIAVLTGTSPFA